MNSKSFLKVGYKYDSLEQFIMNNNTNGIKNYSSFTHPTEYYKL